MATSPQSKELWYPMLRKPDAQALISGSKKFSQVSGTLNLYQTKNGVIVAANINGLPCGQGPCGSQVFGFHIHEGKSCAGNATDPFADAGMHYNPNNCDHPHHAGDLPPLFGNNGHAEMMVLTNRFTVAEVIGRTVVVHRSPDDFKTQPAGSSGEKMACGVIQRR